MSRMLEKLFSPFAVNSLILPNRLIRAPMYEPYCPNLVPTEQLISIHERHALGGVGLTTTGFFAVLPEGRIAPHQCDLSACSVSDLEPLVSRVHDAGGLICCDIAFTESWVFPHEKYPDEKSLKHITKAFAKAAELCMESGFDAVEIGPSFVMQFAYEHYNTRTDSYGQDRGLYPVELISSIRKAVGDSYPLFLKQLMNPPMAIEEMVSLAQRYEEAGIDCIVSCRSDGLEDIDMHELYTLDEARAVREAVEIPVCYSSGVDDSDDLEFLMEEFELVQVGRSLLRDYDFPLKVMRGEEPVECVKCDSCHAPLFKAEDPELKCVFE